MSNELQIVTEEIELGFLPIRNLQVFLGSYVAVLYRVETKRINKAVKNNPYKFAENNIFELMDNEINYIISNDKIVDGNFGHNSISKINSYKTKFYECYFKSNKL